MSYEVKLNEADGIVDVIYNGTVTLEERKQAVDEGCSLYAHMRPQLILVNARKLEMDLTMEEQQIFGEYLASHPKLAQARVAVLHEESDNPNLFVDHFASINGYKLAQFINDDEAH